jgi:hypothetical protein
VASPLYAFISKHLLLLRENTHSWDVSTFIGVFGPNKLSLSLSLSVVISGAFINFLLHNHFIT